MPTGSSPRRILRLLGATTLTGVLWTVLAVAVLGGIVFLLYLVLSALIGLS